MPIRKTTGTVKKGNSSPDTRNVSSETTRRSPEKITSRGRKQLLIDLGKDIRLILVKIDAGREEDIIVVPGHLLHELVGCYAVVIDLIEQHHGSGLVSYFYRQALKRHLEDPTIPEPEEMSFRYPCPKPQTKEAVVLMMADACESASRSLVEPTPARVQNLVRSISQERLEDEQFDESGITLTELRTIEASIVKSLISLHHGRIKYPDKIEKDKFKGK